MDKSDASPQEQKVNSIISEAAKQTTQREGALKNIPSDKGPSPSYPGAGFVTGQPPGYQKQTEAKLKSEVEAIREGALNDTAKAIDGAPIKTQVKAYKIADDFAYPATARQNDPALKKSERKGLDETQRSAMHQMGHTDMKERGAKEKNISESQDYAMRQMSGEGSGKTSPTSQNDKNPDKPGNPPQRFSSLLGYSKLNKAAEKTPEGKTGKQPMAMSGKFSATLGYNKMPNKSEASPAKSTKSKGVDRDR